MQQDTIFALSSGRPPAAIAVIRISGPHAHQAAERIAGAAKDHPWILVFGLILSVILMGVAANFIARYIERYRWIAWIGLAVIVWVACGMIYDGIVHPEVGIHKLV